MALSDRPNGPISGAASVPNRTPLNVQAAQAGPLPVLQLVSVATETQIMSAENVLVPLSIALPPATADEQTVLDLFASGYFKQTAATGTITLKLYSGVSVTIASNQLLGSSGAITQTIGTAAWWAHAQLIYDSVSGTLAGKIDFYVNKIVVAAVTFSNFPANVSNLNNPVAQFSLTVTSSAATGPLPTSVNVQKFSVG
jgi:hypothetical protein